MYPLARICAQGREPKIPESRHYTQNLVATGGRDEEESSVTQTREGRSKIRIVSEPQAATAYRFLICLGLRKKFEKSERKRY
jgi:hypothetical protein